MHCIRWLGSRSEEGGKGQRVEVAPLIWGNDEGIISFQVGRCKLKCLMPFTSSVALAESPDSKSVLCRIARIARTAESIERWWIVGYLRQDHTLEATGTVSMRKRLAKRRLFESIKSL